MCISVNLFDPVITFLMSRVHTNVKEVLLRKHVCSALEFYLSRRKGSTAKNVLARQLRAAYDRFSFFSEYTEET
jgi:hypothetical protein